MTTLSAAPFSESRIINSLLLHESPPLPPSVVGEEVGEGVGALVGAAVGLATATSQSSSPAKKESQAAGFSTNSHAPEERRQAAWVPLQPPRDWQVHVTHDTVSPNGALVGVEVGVEVGVAVG